MTDWPVTTDVNDHAVKSTVSDSQEHTLIAAINVGDVYRIIAIHPVHQPTSSNHQHLVHRQRLWLKCHRTQRNAVSPPLVYASRRSPNWNFLKTRGNVTGTLWNGFLTIQNFALRDIALTLSPPIPFRHYILPYWSNPSFLFSDIRALWRSVLSARVPECQKLKMVG